MVDWHPRISSSAARRTIIALGGGHVVLAAWQATQYTLVGAPLLDVVSAILLVGVPGVVVLSVGYRLPELGITPETYSSVLVWTLGGFVLLLAVVGMLVLSPGFSIDNADWSAVLATAIGTVAGSAIGLYQARAFTRAHDAEAAQRELEQTVERLEASNERLEQFTYAASHDLQEPLRMVSSYLQLLEARYADELDEDAEEFIEFAVDGADRMRAMIGSLLDYSRVRSQGNVFEPTDVDSLLDDVLTDLQPQIEETEASVSTDDLPTVTADTNQLRQVFQNLLSNALKFGGEEAPQVHVSAERADNSWRFSVADEGIGIAPEHHARIFKTFQRLHADQGEVGTGIGLALCERIVERHDGEIWVESEPDEGATFYFTIPLTGDRGESRSHVQATSSSR